MIATPIWFMPAAAPTNSSCVYKVCPTKPSPLKVAAFFLP
ncbi:Uncharacterised protein [Vibrio cholerae]|nr:Uncharacterised protein [Vibrio cholerae]